MANPDLSRGELDLLRQAIALGRQGMEAGSGGPFGAVIASTQGIEAVGFNRVLQDLDPTAHAEIVAIRVACAARGGPWLTGATLYASCEPCPMCLAAIYWARIDRVVYAAGREDAAAIGFDDATFYEDLENPSARRRHFLRQSLREEARAMMEAWKARGPEAAY